jgi:hypothetical protein
MDIVQILEGRGAKSPIIAEAHAGPRMGEARGLSIYFPLRDVWVFYRELAFAQRTRWADFLKAYLARGPRDTR